MGRLRNIPDGVIKIPVPGVRQRSGYTCGAVALMSIMAYYGVGPENQLDYVEALKIDPNKGTSAQALARFARKHGLNAQVRKDLTISELCNFLDSRRPVICNLQAHSTEEWYEKRLAGHYVVAIGYDAKNIYFEDPLLDAFRGYLSKSEFDRRWHDMDYNGREFNHLGIVIWRPYARHYLIRGRKIP